VKRGGRNEKRSWRKRRGAGEWISLSTPSVMVQRFCGQLLVFNTDLPNLAYNICIQWRWDGQAGVCFSLLSPSSPSPPVFSLLEPQILGTS
jgi:hypothetical protein